MSSFVRFSCSWVQADSVGQHRASLHPYKKQGGSLHPDSPCSYSFSLIYTTGSDLGRSSRRSPLSATYFSSTWHFIPVVLPGLCAHVPSYSRVFFRPVRFMLTAVAHFVRSCLRSHPSGRTYPTTFTVSAPLRQNRPLIPHPVLSACLPISPTQRYRGGSVAFVLALVVFVLSQSVAKSFAVNEVRFAAAAGIDPARSPSRPSRPLFGHLYNSN